MKQHKLFGFLAIFAVTALILAGCEAASDDGGGGDTAAVTVPNGLTSDCNSVTEGGTLNTSAGGAKSDTIEPGECVTYSFVGDANTAYTVTLKTNSGNADLILAFNQAYTSQLDGSPSTNSSTDNDIISFLSSSRLRKFGLSLV
ncbi:MAG: hypothetical protein IID61_16635 [SAR324 cluster bacterium]|nr:hypothetical protein [SAR324 cluster bacterium]